MSVFDRKRQNLLCQRAVHGKQAQIATLQTWNVTPQNSKLCHFRVIVRIMSWMRREQQDEISTFACICVQRSAVECRHLISCARSSKCWCNRYRQTLGRMELFCSIIVSSLSIFSGLRKLWVELAVYDKKYSSFNEQRYAWCGSVVYHLS